MVEEIKAGVRLVAAQAAHDWLHTGLLAIVTSLCSWILFTTISNQGDLKESKEDRGAIHAQLGALNRTVEVIDERQKDVLRSLGQLEGTLQEHMQEAGR